MVEVLVRMPFVIFTDYHQPLTFPIVSAGLVINYRTFFLFYVVRTVHFGMKLYNDQRHAQVFNLFIYLFLPYMFRAFF
jgi:hypothetical protein